MGGYDQDQMRLLQAGNSPVDIAIREDVWDWQLPSFVRQVSFQARVDHEAWSA
jgi:hypothetical protein